VVGMTWTSSRLGQIGALTQSNIRISWANQASLFGPQISVKNLKHWLCRQQFSAENRQTSRRYHSCPESFVYCKLQHVSYKAFLIP